MAESRGPYQRMSPSADNPRISEQQQQSKRRNPRDKYKGLLYKFGITEVVFGSISILLAIVTLIIAANHKTYTESYFSSYYNRTIYHYYNYYHTSTHPSQGIWCGALLIVTGILGIKTKSNTSVCIFNANMALSIITACFMVPLITISGIAAHIYSIRAGTIQSLAAIHSLLAILGLPAGIICIVHSAYCCAGVCCQRKAYQDPVTYVAQPYGTHQPQQMVRLANGQYMLVPFQPMAAHGYSQATACSGLYPPPQTVVVMPQTAMQPQADVQPTVIYPGGAQQAASPTR